MKKAFLILAAFVTVTASAQNKEVDAIVKRLDKSKETIADSKKSSSASVWIDHANVLIDASNAYTSKLIAGFMIDQVTATIGAPQSTEEVDLGGTIYKKYVFADFDVYTDETGEIQFWQAKKTLDPDALTKAYEALVKAKELNAKDFASKGVIPVGRLQNQLQTEGMTYYSLDERAKAGELFEQAIKVSALLNATDTAMMYYAGVAYSDAEQYAKAIPLLEQAVKLGYDQEGNTYYYLAWAQQEAGKTDDAIATLENAFAKYPESESIMSLLINFYLNNDKDPKAILDIIKKAQEVNPDNISFYLTEGAIWDKLGDEKKSEEALMKAYSMDPQNFATLFNIGIIRARKGDQLVEQANKLDINDVENYNRLIEEAIPFYDGAIEMLEKAHQLDPLDFNTVEVLRSLYYPRRDDPKFEARYRYFDELYMELQKE